MVFYYAISCKHFPQETFMYWLAVWTQEWVWQEQDKAAEGRLEEAEACAAIRRGARVH